MSKVALHFSLLMVGLVISSQVAPLSPGAVAVQSFLATTCLCFLLIQTGLAFEIERSRVAEGAWDWFVATVSAACPWLLVSIYFLAVFLPTSGWNDSGPWLTALLSARFAAPSSVGVLVIMLAAAGVSSGWLHRKARGLAVLGNVATVLLMLPLKIFMVGYHWQMGAMLVALAALLILARWKSRCLGWPVSWPWRLGYAIAITTVTGGIHRSGRWIDDVLPLQIEVLLPALVLGCLLVRPQTQAKNAEAAEHRAEAWMAGVFMLLVGASMPPLSMASSGMSPGMLATHVLCVTGLSCLGRLFPLLCYRRQASFRQRLALCLGLWPRGEVGVGMLLLSVSYGVGGAMVIVAAYSLALNLLCTGLFALAIKRLMASSQRVQA